MMSSAKRPSTVEEFKLENRYDLLRKELTSGPFSQRLDHPVSFWALPTDRRLPLAFMGWPLRELLSKDFGELMGTAGIGRKKVAALLELLVRATRSDPEQEFGVLQTPPEQSLVSAVDQPFDADCVSEAHWVRWCDTVERHQVGHLVLGRLAPTLEMLPTVIWDTPLNFYVGRTLAEIRGLKTHGEKRVRAVLEVFSIVHEALSEAKVLPHVNVQLVPKFVPSLNRWFSSLLADREQPSTDEMSENLAVPLVDQIRLDLGETVAELAAGRLGVTGAPQSVRRQAEQMDVTRARVYQLLDDCATVMRVRWPEGQWLMAALEPRFAECDPDHEGTRLYYAIVDLFFPRGGDPSQPIAPRTSDMTSSVLSVRHH